MTWVLPSAQPNSYSSFRSGSPIRWAFCAGRCPLPWYPLSHQTARFSLYNLLISCSWLWAFLGGTYGDHNKTDFSIFAFRIAVFSYCSCVRNHVFSCINDMCWNCCEIPSDYLRTWGDQSKGKETLKRRTREFSRLGCLRGQCMGETLILLFGFGLLAGYKYMFRNGRTGSESSVYLSLAIGAWSRMFKILKASITFIKNL